MPQPDEPPIIDSHPELPTDSDAVVPRPAHVQAQLVLLVAIGGALGACLRYALARAVRTGTDGWPTATFVTNLVGAFLLGVLLEALARSGMDSVGRRAVRLGVGTGVLGAFTTYSTLATEVVLLGRDSHPALAAAYGLTSAAGGFLAAGLGIALAALGHHRLSRSEDNSGRGEVR